MERDDKMKARQQGTSVKSVTSSRKSQHQSSAPRKSSSSKFNRILGNLERSILSHLNVHNNEHGNLSGPNATSKLGTSNKPFKETHEIRRTKNNLKDPHTFYKESREPPNTDKVSATISPTSALQASITKVVEQLPGKSTPNKQQSLWPTLRQNQLAMANKLSIPPPHANEEARSHNQSLFFSEASNSTLPNRLSYDASASNNNNNREIPALLSSASTSSERHNSGNFGIKSLEERHKSQVDSSPASSAKSLPAVAPKSGSQLSKKNPQNSADDDEDEESGFSTYQSRRSLLATGKKQSSPTISPAAGETHNNNMILMQKNQAVMSFNGKLSYCNAPVSHISQPRMQLFYNYQNAGYGPMNNVGQQQQTHASNSVPIMSTMNPSKSNRLSNEQNLYFVARTNQMQPPVNQHLNQAYTQQRQVYNHYSPQQVGSYDVDQQIYANAPPKPRRYQYHDATNSTTSITNVHLPQHISTDDIPSIHQPALYNQQQLNYQMYQQQLLQQQPSNHTSYLSVPSLHQDRHDPGTFHRNQSLASNFKQSQPILPPQLPRLVKSKSSLDAGDLIRFKQTKQPDLDQFCSATLRPQNQLTRQINGQTQVRVAQHQQLQNQPIYGSRLDNINSQYQPHDLTYMQQPMVNGNLQRSKSVTHLLPEGECQEQYQNGTGQFLFEDTNSSTAHKFLSTSSASTTNLNLAGLKLQGQVRPPMQALTNQNYRPMDLMQYQYNQNMGMQQRYHDMSNHIPQGHQQFPQSTLVQQNYNDRMNLWNKHQTQPTSMIGANFVQHNSKAKQSLLPATSSNSNGQNNNTNRIVRLSPRDSFVAQDTHSFVKPSLDDKIRYLLIGDRDKDNECSTNASHGTESRNLIQQASYPSRINDNPVSSLDRLQKQVLTQSSANNEAINIENNGRPINNSISIMGNRQQRQYQVNKCPKEDFAGSRCANDGANSHLIVDLTTPRVLAKTQTTLLSAENQTNGSTKDSWSLNQLGLPEIDSNHPNSKMSNRQSPFVDSTRRSSLMDQDLPKKPESDTDKPSCGQESIFERTAPYYYSDLKSEEQQQALLSIVQQKSLSPPPQLLSRSTDQSSTRLALKSATMHQTNTSSKNLTERQRLSTDMQTLAMKHSQLLKNDASTNFSSAMNIAKNIDKLFDSPATKPVQSMLTLNACQDSNESSQLRAIQTSATSHIKCGRFSKSKSLDNLSQKSAISDSGLVINPVYENIHRSNKLIRAIENSASSLGSPIDSAKPVMVSNSDDSMDSILGSSLDDSDSSLDIIDEIKITSTDNHLTDISQLIEQLKSNHSKLTDEYKSTLTKISKTINTRNKQEMSDQKKEKLVRRLHLLEMKSKKCESRSKNQLALIQMMENVLRQSKLRASSNRTQAQTNDSSKLSSGQNGNDVVPSVTESPANRASDNPQSQEIIKAIVTETTEEFIKRPSTIIETKDSIVTSKISAVDHSNNDEHDNTVSKKIKDIEMRNNLKQSAQRTNNPFCSNSLNVSISDNSASGCAGETNGSVSSSIIQPAANEVPAPITDRSSVDNSFNSMRDDEDFIEFLSDDRSSHRSQFEASQFSVSDFNTSGSASESSTSGAVNDSLSSLINSNNSNDKSSSKPMSPDTRKFVPPKSACSKKGGILKNRHSSDNKNFKRYHQNNNDNDGFNKKSDKFDNVFGNVVDVDISPMDNLTHCSPVNN